MNLEILHFAQLVKIRLLHILYTKLILPIIDDFVFSIFWGAVC